MRGQRFFRKSDNPLISRFFLAAALASLTLLLSACPNPVSTGLVLSVVGTNPSNGATMVDPGGAIVVTFNKDLDPASLQQVQSPITIAPNTLNPSSTITLTFSYDSPTKKLSIEPHPFLESNHAYTLTFETSLKDTSGETLPKQVDFSFTTGNQPAGDIQFNPNVPYLTALDNPPPVTLSLRYNDQTKSMRISNDQAAWKDVPLALNVSSWLLTPDDGPKTVYVQFFDSSNNPSAVRSASIVRDTVPPAISSVTVPTYYNMYNDASNPALRLVASATDATSGIAHYTWTSAGVTFNTASPYSEQSPAITISGKDGPYTVSLTVTDGAGLMMTIPQPFTIIKDATPPGPPTNAPQGYTSSSWFDYPYKMNWYWKASTTSNLYSTPDTFLILLNGKTPQSGALLLSQLPDYYGYGTVIADHYDTYTLTVRQVDAAGNQSDALSMPIIVAPVMPPSGSTDISQFTGLKWRNFSGQTGTYYRVHLWAVNSPSTDLGSIPDPLGKDIAQSGPYTTLVPGQTYNWYIQWNFDGSTTYLAGNRSPSDGTYYTFTVAK